MPSIKSIFISSAIGLAVSLSGPSNAASSQKFDPVSFCQMYSNMMGDAADMRDADKPLSYVRGLSAEATDFRNPQQAEIFLAIVEGATMVYEFPKLNRIQIEASFFTGCMNKMTGRAR